MRCGASATKLALPLLYSTHLFWDLLLSREMESLENRLFTFSGWPLPHLTPRQLAEAGFVYCGKDDTVRCHSCSVRLGQWQVNEEPWKEHARHRPGCLFLQLTRPDVLLSVQGLLENRLASFDGWSHTARAVRLAEAGFFYSGVRDEIVCHSCLLTIQVSHWQADEDVWKKHHKYSPGCSFVLHHCPSVRASMNSALQRFCSFAKWPKKNIVPIPKLVAAGFFYTGISDQVQCYLCNGTFEQWEAGDEPHLEHARHFPRCSQSKHQGGALEVFPRDLKEQSRSEVAVRLASFWNWPSCPANKLVLSAAGFTFTGKCDGVQCFCCGGSLSCWEANDHPWVEHLRHFPHCEHALCRAPVNVLITRMDELHVRLASFSRRPASESTIPADALAKAGFFYTGALDRVRCFACGVMLAGWKLDEQPWSEHRSHSSGCWFVKKFCPNLPSCSSQASVPNHSLDTVVVSQLVGMGFTHAHIGRAVHKHPECVSFKAEQMVDILLSESSDAAENGHSSSSRAVKQDSELRSHQQGAASLHGSSSCAVKQDIKLRSHRQGAASLDSSAQPTQDYDRLLCKVCLDAEIRVLFSPCGHLACCAGCAPALQRCPICRRTVTSKMQAIVA